MKKLKWIKNKSFLIIMILVVLYMFLGVGYSLLSENLTIMGTAKTGKINNDTDGVLPEGKDFDVTFHEINVSGTTYNYEVSLKNITNTASTQWKIYILVPSDTKLSTTWGCSGVIENGILIVTSSNWNGSIAAGAEAGHTAGFTFITSDNSVIPLKYTALMQ